MMVKDLREFILENYYKQISFAKKIVIVCCKKQNKGFSIVSYKLNKKKYLTLKNTIDCFKSKGKQIHKTSNNDEIEFATVGQYKAASNLWKPIKQ